MVNVIASQEPFDEQAFKQFCKKHDLSFPDAYLQFLRNYNNVELEDNILNDSKEGIYVRYFYGTTEEDFWNIEYIYENYINRMPKKCVAIADPDFGNQICMSLQVDTYGKIYFWDHETMDVDFGEVSSLTMDALLLLADSFEEFLERIIPNESNIVIENSSNEFFAFLKRLFKRK